MQVVCLAAVLINVAGASECAICTAQSWVGSAMVQVRTGLGLVPQFGDRGILPETIQQVSQSFSAALPQGNVFKTPSPDSARSAAVTAAKAAAGVHAEAHRALQERLNEAIEAGQQAIAQDRQLLKLPSAGQDAPKTELAPAINQMLELAANSSQRRAASRAPLQTPSASTSLDLQGSVPIGGSRAAVAVATALQQVSNVAVAPPSSTEDLPELIATENHMHMQASATTRRVADALQGAVNAEQEAQTLEAKAAELRANASLILQRGAATAEQASAEIAKQTAQVALSEMSEIEQQAESAEISAASYRAKADSASQQANAAVRNMYHALNMSNSK